MLKPRTCELDQLVRPNVTHGYLPVANIARQFHESWLRTTPYAMTAASSSTEELLLFLSLRLGFERRCNLIDHWSRRRRC